MMTTWKKRALGMLILALGMATTIATSAIEFDRTESVAVAHEAGVPTTVVAFMDVEAGARSSLVMDLILVSSEDPGPITATLDDGTEYSVPVEMVVPETGAPEEYWGRLNRWSSITCHEGADRCSNVFSIELTNPVDYDVTGTVSLISGEEFAEDTLFIVDPEQ